MLNDPLSYVDAGTKCGIARNRRDENTAKFHSDWFQKALALEAPEDKAKARLWFNDAYRAARTGE